MSSRVYLRRFESEDLEFVNGIVSENGIFAQTLANARYASKDHNLQFLNNAMSSNDPLYLVICLSESKLPIGYLSVRDFDRINQKVKFAGIMISNVYSGKGYASEAACLMVDFLFSEQNIHKIYGYWLESNTPSIRIAEKLGFNKDGLLRDEVYKNGKYNNAYIMSLLSSEWEGEHDD